MVYNENEVTYLKSTSIKVIDVDDLDIDFEEKHISNFHNKPFAHTEFVYDNTKLKYTTPIDINLLIDKIYQLKEKGSNYVAIEHDVDHNGYIIEGMLIEKPKDNEIKEFKKKENEIKKLEKKHKKLEKQIQENEKEYYKLIKIK